MQKQKQIISCTNKLVLLCMTLFIISTSFGQKPGGNMIEAVSHENPTVISSKKVFDIDGNISYSIRNYSEELLPPFINTKIHKKYPGKSIWGVTELSSEDGLLYKVFLQDDKYWYHLSVNTSGDILLDDKFIKG